MVATEQSSGPKINQPCALVGVLLSPLICMEVFVALVVTPAPSVLAVLVQLALPWMVSWVKGKESVSKFCGPNGRVSEPVTVPVTATLTLVASVLAKVMLPDFAPLRAEALIRTETVPLADPPLCVIVAVPPKFVPSLATSKSVGAVTVMSAVKFEPVALKVCAADAVPAVVLKDVNVPVVLMAGVEPAKSVITRSSILTLVVPVLVIRTRIEPD